MLSHPLDKLTAWCGTVAVVASVPVFSSAQARKYPDTIRGYKVERTVVEIRRPENKARGGNGEGETATDNSDVNQLITFGQPSIARATPLGVTFEVPVIVAPVRQSGKG